MNKDDIIKFWKLLDHKNQTELRAIIPQIEVRSHHFSTQEELLELCDKYNGKYNIYLGVNERKEFGTKREDVKNVKIVPIDIDCVTKPASDEDIMKANFIATVIIKDAQAQGFQKPTICFSGNGYQLFFKLPEIILSDNHVEIEEKLQQFQRVLIKKYSDSYIRLDNVGDLPRIMRVPGTYNIKSKTNSKIIELNDTQDPILSSHILSLTSTESTQINSLSEELKNKIKGNEKIGRYMDGELQGKASRSEAEMSLCCLLVQIGLNKEQTFSVMSNCKMGKWQESNVSYRELTYKKAIEIITKEKTVEEGELIFFRNKFSSFMKDKNWSECSEMLCNYVKDRKKIFTTKDDNKSEMWVYDEGVYVPNGKSEIKQLLREVMGSIYSTWHYNQCLGKVEADTFVDAIEFFKIGHMDEVPVMNGILNIKTRELKPFDSDRIFFNKMPVLYNPDASCQKIESFLEDVLSTPDDKLVFYELGGFSLLKTYTYEKAFMLHGSGRNGKGKTIDLLRRTVGASNCVSLPLSSLKSDNFQISGLFGKQLNLAGDLDSKDMKDTATFKSLTGRDLITGKRKFLPDIHFENYAKMVFACNELPMVYDLSTGFWDRWILLDFPYYFADKQKFDSTPEKDRQGWKIRDDKILDKITTPEELSGLLNNFLDGLDRLNKNKRFSSSRGTDEIKNTWIRKANSFVAFCMDMIEEDYDSRISKKNLRKEYSRYCKKHRVGGKSDKMIHAILQEMFGASDEQSMELGQWDRYWTGIKFKEVVVE